MVEDRGTVGSANNRPPPLAATLSKGRWGDQRHRCEPRRGYLLDDLPIAPAQPPSTKVSVEPRLLRKTEALLHHVSRPPYRLRMTERSPTLPIWDRSHGLFQMSRGHVGTDSGIHIERTRPVLHDYRAQGRASCAERARWAYSGARKSYVGE